MNEAIKLAVEKGGYDRVGWNPLANRPRHGTDLNEIVLDPNFWQALGKALGWGDGEWICTTCRIPLNECFSPDVHTSNKSLTWLEHALRFFELTLSQGDTEAFWKELLNAN